MIHLPGKTSDFLNFGLATAKKGSLSEVKQILQQRPDWLNRDGPHGRTMLWEAAYRGRTKIVQYLLEIGADPHQWGCYFTPMYVEVSAYAAAVWKNRADTVRLLQERYQPLDFFSAVFLGEYERVKELIEKQPDIVNQEKQQHDREVGFTSVHYAISGSYVNILELILKHDPKPIHHKQWLVKFAIWRGDLEILHVLLQAGIIPDRLKWEPVFAKNSKIQDALLNFGISIDPNVSERGWPPLVYESRGDRGGNIRCIQELLDLGADVNIRNHKGETALHCASKAGFVPVVELLLANGAHIDILDNNGSSPLQHAIRSTIKSSSKRARVISTLLRHGADIANLSEYDRRKLDA
ncbi:MAG: ankyrin repeat domain-containing protein [Gammaproteobacteria bacterium]|nr:ankyrin repeat domain-containing protein [Gammaproteobacteria bacterium]